MTPHFQTPHFRRERPGFTLVELGVVIAIIVFLAALLVAFLPAMSSQTAEANGAANLQGWLNIARQKAIRNQNPYGVRLWVKDTTTMWVTECQNIEQPDDFNGGGTGTATVSVGVNAGVYDLVTFTGADITGGLGLADATIWPVQIGDNFEVAGTGLMHRIIAVDGTNQQVTLATGTPFPITSATNWRILRQARVIGTETLPLPTDVIIDLSTNVGTSSNKWVAPYTNALPVTTLAAGGAYVDVLFSPSGAVITPNLTQPFMGLWVRLPDANSPVANSQLNVFAGTPTIIAVFAQTGLVGAYPPVSTGANPYYDVK